MFFFDKFINCDITDNILIKKQKGRNLDKNTCSARRNTHTHTHT